MFFRVEELPVDQISDAYLLDFVGPPGFVQQLSPKVDRVIILDHHKTALKMLEDGEFDSENVTKVIDMGRSGATIAYDYFKEKISALAKGNNMSGLRKFERSRRLFEYIEDADLWHWRLHNSKAFSSGLKDSNIEFSLSLNPSLFQQVNLFGLIIYDFTKKKKKKKKKKKHRSNEILQLLSLDVEHVINQGVSSLAHKQTLINEVLDQSYEIVLDDGSYCLAVNADAVSDLRSELGHQLAEKSRNRNLRGIGAVVYRVPELKDDQILKISLRSIDNEDTTSISQKHGGGGHRNASSFMLSCQEFEQWKVGCAANGA
ncbi:putative DHH phosphoesterase superfamily [Helianthus annuus]|nr:putative DHH phosphoesterase superfamily [Helianthus annuus]